MRITEEDVYISNHGLIQEACRRYRKGMEYDDCFLAASEGFLYAVRNYRQGISEFKTYAMTIMREQIVQEQKELNRIRSIESPLSLDRTVKEEKDSSTLGNTFFKHSYDFVGRLLLKDFLDSLQEEARSIAWMYIDGYTDKEIMKQLRIAPEKLGVLRKAIYTVWAQYNQENKRS